MCEAVVYEIMIMKYMTEVGNMTGSRESTNYPSVCMMYYTYSNKIMHNG
jgi:hypothetical protein